LAQHVLPPGFKQVRYYGLHATCKAAKVRKFLKALLLKMGRVLEETTRQVKHYSYRQGVARITGKDPFVCERCGAEMWLLPNFTPF
jgi:hypothetical protein